MESGRWAVPSAIDTVMTWNYDVENADLRALYEKAKRDQWNATTQLDWSLDVDPQGDVLDDDINPNVALLRDSDIWRKMTPSPNYSRTSCEAVNSCQNETTQWSNEAETRISPRSTRPVCLSWRV